MVTTLDYQRIVEEIQSALAYDAPIPEGTLNEVPSDYSVACEEANQQRRKCTDLLRRGLRGERVQRCEIDPNFRRRGRARFSRSQRVQRLGRSAAAVAASGADVQSDSCRHEMALR